MRLNLIFLAAAIYCAHSTSVEKSNDNGIAEEKLDYYPDPRYTLARAVDVNLPVSTAAFSCMKNQMGFQTAFVRIFSPQGNGQADPNGPPTLLNANAAGMGLEVYIQPQPRSSTYGYQQFDTAVNYVTSHGVQLRSVWLQVTSPINWPNNHQGNINFINSFVQRAQQRNLRLSIYTNQYDWQQITGNWYGANQLQLWYWHSSGNGANGCSAANFNDFVPFAGWTAAKTMVKQNCKQLHLSQCNWIVDTDVYKVNKKLYAKYQATVEERTAKNEAPIAGLIGDMLQE